MDYSCKNVNVFKSVNLFWQTKLLIVNLKNCCIIETETLGIKFWVRTIETETLGIEFWVRIIETLGNRKMTFKKVYIYST